VAPNREVALEKYRRVSHARRPAWIERLCSRAIARVDLQAGDVVLDVGCGTGYWFPAIEQAIGPDGRLVGIEQSPDMLAKARETIRSHGWRNISLIEAPAEEAAISVSADAVIFLLTHDIMRTPRALENVLRFLKPEGRVVAAGGMWAAWWLAPANLYVWWASRRYVTTFEGFSRPWSLLEQYLANTRVEIVSMGRAGLRRGYIAWGTTPVG
jgi:ubiquinone/menaquinone biosynthesis C-methylase UbiE